MKRLMKKHRYVWKRMRQAPAKSPAPHQDERRKVFMHHLQQREAVGAGALWYFDGTGFASPHVSVCWATNSHTSEIPASSHRQGVNV